MPTSKTPKTKTSAPATKTPRAKKPAATKSAPTKTKAAPKTAKTSAAPILVELNGQTVQIKNEGQKVLYMIRKAYLEGTLSISENPTPEVQRILNQPISIRAQDFQADPRDRDFLSDIIKKVEAGSIKLFTPSSLLNTPVYDRLPSQIKAKADYDILIIISKIRQIKKLWDDGSRDSYQILNLAHSLRLAKESLESQEGDVFII